MSIPFPPPIPHLSAKERAAAIRRLEERRHHTGDDSSYQSTMRWNTGPTIVSAFPLFIR
jgi:hypothetical protein